MTIQLGEHEARVAAKYLGSITMGEIRTGEDAKALRNVYKKIENGINEDLKKESPDA